MAFLLANGRHFSCPIVKTQENSSSYTRTKKHIWQRLYYAKDKKILVGTAILFWPRKYQFPGAKCKYYKNIRYLSILFEIINTSNILLKSLILIRFYASIWMNFPYLSASDLFYINYRRINEMSFFNLAKTFIEFVTI